MLVESGCIRNRTTERRFDAIAGDMICLPPTEYNTYGNRGPTVYYQAHIAFAAPPHHRAGPWLNGIGPLPIHLRLRNSFHAMRRVFETLCIELGQAGPAHQLRLRAAVFEMLAIIIEAKKHNTSGAQRLDDWQRIRLRLDSEWGAELKIEELATQMGISVDHFIRRFKQRFGTSPKVYQTHARLREAIRLLRGTDKSTKTIAYELGFTDSKSFFRLVKKHLGVVPSNLRLLGNPEDKIRPATQSLFPINRHVLPAHAGPRFEKQWHLRKKKRA